MQVSMKAMRVNAEMSQEQAAKAIGTTKRTLCSWENHETFPNALQLKRLCDVYGCEMNDIFLPDTPTNSEER